VAMRWRKPWRLARLRVLGWNGRFTGPPDRPRRPQQGLARGPVASFGGAGARAARNAALWLLRGYRARRHFFHPAVEASTGRCYLALFANAPRMAPTIDLPPVVRQFPQVWTVLWTDETLGRLKRR
jgi:hypothetical protein